MRKLAFISSILFLNLNYAQNTSYKFDYYDISNGLSQNRAQAIFQANDGYIYVGSQGGLDRFDGYDFKYYSHNPVDTTSIPYGWVNAIGQDNFGNIWATTRKGLFSLSGNKITVYGTKNGFVSDDMFNVKISKQNTVWVSGEGFLSSKDGDVVRNYSRTNDSTRFFGYNAGLLVLNENDKLTKLILFSNLSLFFFSKTVLFTTLYSFKFICLCKLVIVAFANSKL